MVSINLLLLTWKPGSGRQGASSASVQRERLSERGANSASDSLTSDYNHMKSESATRSGSTTVKTGVTNLIVRLIGWAGNMTASGLQFQGIMTE